MIYLATPYSHPRKMVMRLRFELACQICGELMRKGLHVFSPIAHCHPIKQFADLPHAWEYWADIDRDFISRCDRLIVVKMDGWDKSKGVQAEIEIAKELGKPIMYLSLDEALLHRLN